MITTVQFVSVLLGALVVGAMFGIWRGYNPASFSYTAFVEMHQNAVRGLNTLLPVIGALTILTTLISAYIQRENSSVMWVLVGAAVCFIASALVTRFGNQPINAVVMNWSPNTEAAGWTALRDKWWMYHVVRFATGFVGLCLLIFASISASPLRGMPARP